MHINLENDEGLFFECYYQPKDTLGELSFQCNAEEAFDYQPCKNLKTTIKKNLLVQNNQMFDRELEIFRGIKNELQ